MLVTGEREQPDANKLLCTSPMRSDESNVLTQSTPFISVHFDIVTSVTRVAGVVVRVRAVVGLRVVGRMYT